MEVFKKSLKNKHESFFFILNTMYLLSPYILQE